MDSIFIEFTKNPTGQTNLVFSAADMGIVAAIRCDRYKLICLFRTFMSVGQHRLSVSPRHVLAVDACPDKSILRFG